MAESRVGVLGASSLVGGCVLPMLRDAGWQVVAFSRTIAENGFDVEWRLLPFNEGMDWHHIRCPRDGRDAHTITVPQTAKVKECLENNEIRRAAAVDHDGVRAPLPLRKETFETRNLVDHAQARCCLDKRADCILRLLLAEKGGLHEGNLHFHEVYHTAVNTI